MSIPKKLRPSAVPSSCLSSETLLGQSSSGPRPRAGGSSKSYAYTSSLRGLPKATVNTLGIPRCKTIPTNLRMKSKGEARSPHASPRPPQVAVWVLLGTVPGAQRTSDSLCLNPHHINQSLQMPPALTSGSNGCGPHPLGYPPFLPTSFSLP